MLKDHLKQTGIVPQVWNPNDQRLIKLPRKLILAHRPTSLVNARKIDGTKKISLKRIRKKIAPENTIDILNCKL
ncbi:hypothetical protein D9M71_590710 [compost metagenome]